MSVPDPISLSEALELARRAVVEATAHRDAVSESSRHDITRAAAAHPEDIDLLFLAFQFHFRAGNVPEAERLTRRRLDLAPPNSQHKARALCNLGLIAHRQNRFDDAETLLTQAIQIDRELGHLEGMARDIGNLALVPESLGDLDRAEALYHQSLAIARSLPGPGAEDIAAGKLANLGDIARVRGDLNAARALWEEAHSIFHRLGITKWDREFAARLAAVDARPHDPGSSPAAS